MMDTKGGKEKERKGSVHRRWKWSFSNTTTRRIDSEIFFFYYDTIELLISTPRKIVGAILITVAGFFHGNDDVLLFSLCFYVRTVGLEFTVCVGCSFDWRELSWGGHAGRIWILEFVSLWSILDTPPSPNETVIGNELLVNRRSDRIRTMGWFDKNVTNLMELYLNHRKWIYVSQTMNVQYFSKIF